MADPLSVAASIVGILTAAQGISVCITKLVSKAKKAPEEMMELKTTVDTIHAVLSQLQSLLLGQVRLNHARTALVLVDQIVIALSACVNVFSGLDVLVRSLENEESLKVVERLRWMAKSGEIKEQLQKLEMQKSSLTLMLTILTW